MIVSIELNLSHEGESIESAEKKNIEAMNWAIEHCPASYVIPLIDNKHIIERVIDEYKKGVS